MVILRRGGSGGGAPTIFCEGRMSWNDVGDVGDVHGFGAPFRFVCERDGLLGMRRIGSSSVGILCQLRKESHTTSTHLAFSAVARRA